MRVYLRTFWTTSKCCGRVYFHAFAMLSVYSLIYRTLSKIKEDLDKIAAQNKALIVVFKNANKAKIDRCMELLKKSLVHWDVRRHLSIILFLGFSLQCAV